jgi:hypothetical protein
VTSESSAWTSFVRRETEHAGLAALVEADGQVLQVAEDAQAQVLQRPLADPADEVRLQVGRAPEHERADDEGDDDEGQDAAVAGDDPVVDGELGQRRRRERRGRREQERHEHADDPRPVRAQELEQAAHLAPAAARRVQAPAHLLAGDRNRARVTPAGH